MLNRLLGIFKLKVIDICLKSYYKSYTQCLPYTQFSFIWPNSTNQKDLNILLYSTESITGLPMVSFYYWWGFVCLFVFCTWEWAFGVLSQNKHLSFVQVIFIHIVSRSFSVCACLNVNAITTTFLLIKIN